MTQLKKLLNFFKNKKNIKYKIIKIKINSEKGQCFKKGNFSCKKRLDFNFRY